MDDHLNFDPKITGEIQEFEVVVESYVPGVAPSRRRIRFVLTPWSHVVKLSADSGYKGDTIECYVNIKNSGTEGKFVVVYELWKRALDSGGRLRDVQKERHIGVDKNGWSVIQLDAGEELQLEAEKFTFRDEGQYFIKTYVLKYQEYV
ncbi:unnamed protein product, partial [marine sediment metagenome]